MGNDLGTESVSAQEAMAQLGSPFARGGYMDFDLNRNGIDAPFPPFPPYPPGLSPPFPPGYQDSYNNPAFTMADGNAVFGVVIPNLGTWIYENISPNFAEPSLAFRYVTIILNVGYDATAPYSRDAVGVYSHITNRPAAEYDGDSTYMNIASIQGMYRLAMAFDASNKAQWDKMLTDNGLDPADINVGIGLGCDNPDLSSFTTARQAAIAIGNIAAQCVMDGRVNDGFNQNFDGTTAGEFVDDTGYTPVNTVDDLVDLSRWQPLRLTASDGVSWVQQYITPQWANTEPYTVDQSTGELLNPREYRTDDPDKSNYYANPEAYKAQAHEVLVAVANLNERQKMTAEYFDNKARETLFFPAVEALATGDKRNHVATNACPPSLNFAPNGLPIPYENCLNTRDFWQLDFMLHIAQFDAGIVTWQEKTRHDAVRPITAIQYLYDGETVDHYTGQVQGEDWQPYVITSDHPEYPSATTCFCAAQAEAWQMYHGGSDAIPDVNGNGQRGDDLAGYLRAGSSVHEPGTTPVAPLYINFNTWTDYKNACAESRIYSGVHFRDAVDASLAVCGDIGAKAFEYFETLLDGTADLKQPAVALTPDPRLSEPNFSARALVCR